PRPQVAAESELAGVCGIYGRADGLDAGDRRHRAESFVVEGGHALLHLCQYGRRVKGALACDGLAPAQHACTFRDTPLDLFMQGIAQVSPSHWSHVSLPVRGIADAYRFGRLDK